MITACHRRDLTPDTEPVSGSIDDDAYRALAAFRRQVREFFAISEAMLEAGGLSPTQYQAMLAIRASPNAGDYTSSHLSRDLFIKLNTAVELIDRMVAAGLVERERDPMDRRRSILRLSSSGSAELQRFARAHLNEHRRLLPGLALTVQMLGDALTDRGADRADT